MGVQDCHTDKLPLLSPPWGEFKSNAGTEIGCSTMHFGVVLNFPLGWIVTLTDTLTVAYAALPAQYLSKSIMSTTAFILITFKKNWVKLQILTSWRSKNSPFVLATRVFSIKIGCLNPLNNYQVINLEVSWRSLLLTIFWKTQFYIGLVFIIFRQDLPYKKQRHPCSYFWKQVFFVQTSAAC